MNKFDILKKFILKYFVILLGFIVFVLYMWNRFFIARTSKDLPLDLDIIGLVILVYICSIFAYILYTLIFPKKSNIIVEKTVDFIFTPLREFDAFIKDLSFIKPYYLIIIRYLLDKVEPLTVSNKYFYLFWVFPRVILLSALFIDIFVFNRFHYKYMVVLFGLILFFNRYFMYSLKYFKKQIIEHYSKEIESILTDYVPGVHPDEDEDDDEWMETMAIPFETFIEFYTKSIAYNDFIPETHMVRSTQFLDDRFWMEHCGYLEDVYKEKFPEDYYKCRKIVFHKTDEYLENIVQYTQRLSLIIEDHKKENNENIKNKTSKIIIYLCYLICWSYVLFISAKLYVISLNDIKLIFSTLFSFQFGVDEFSGLIVEDILPYNHRMFFYDYIDFFIESNLYNKEIVYLKKMIKLCIAYNIMLMVVFKKTVKKELDKNNESVSQNKNPSE